MCCETHDLRDFLVRLGDDGGDLAAVLAPDDMHRCRCTELGKWPGMACQRAATGEDVLCDWCRSTGDHMAWYEHMLKSGHPGVPPYYQQRGMQPSGPMVPAAQAEWQQPWRGGLAPEGTDDSYSPYGRRGGKLSISRADLDELGDVIASEYTSSGYGFSPQPFTFSARDIGELQRGPGGYEFEVSRRMTAEDVVKYLQRKYGA